MTKQYEFRILEETRRASYCGLSELDALESINQNQKLPESGVVQIKCPDSEQVKSFKIVNGSILGDGTSR